jgi:threonine dehydratase
MTVTLQDIQEAAGAIEGHTVRTPCAHSRTLSRITGARVFLKFENLQFTGSFKERGAINSLNALTDKERKSGVIAMSAGNHAQAVAYHAQRLGIPAVIVMPRFTSNLKVEHTRGFGAEVILHGDGLDEAARFAEDMARDKGLNVIHPYDDEQVIAGQGTVALEMLQACPDLDALLIPIGGGGLISGCAVAAKGMRPTLSIIGVEAARFPSMQQALEDLPIRCGKSTIAEGIAVKEPGRITLGLVKDLVDDILLAEEGELEKAVLLLLEVEKTVVEGAGAAGLAALLSHKDRFRDQEVGLILSGGNIDFLVLSSIIQRGLARSGRLVRVRVEVRDVPGALSEVTERLGRTGANIVELSHQRAFTNLPLESAEVEFMLQTRGIAHVKEILSTLNEAGYAARWVDRDAERVCL